MASGKSTVSRLLAQKLGYRFIDTDSIIEKEEGRTIREIFIQEGEAYFRHREEKLLKRIVHESDRAVVATGGGMPCVNENLELMKEQGYTVYLKSSLGDIFSRVKNTVDRPVFLRLAGDRNPEEVAKSLMRRREAFYNRADLQVWNTNSRSPAETAREIARMLSLPEKSGLQ